MKRLSETIADNLSPEQKIIYDDILESRGGSISGPFVPWLLSPVLADRAQKLGAFCRYQTCLPARLSELAILITAMHWRSNVEWQIHAPIAAAAGISQDVIEALKGGVAPNFLRDDEAHVYALATELYATQRVSKSSYDRAIGDLSEKGVVELVGILGYYALVAMTLNVFEIELSDSQSLPFPD